MLFLDLFLDVYTHRGKYLESVAGETLFEGISQGNLSTIVCFTTTPEQGAERKVRSVLDKTDLRPTKSNVVN